MGHLQAQQSMAHQSHIRTRRAMLNAHQARLMDSSGTWRIKVEGEPAHASNNVNK